MINSQLLLNELKSNNIKQLELAKVLNSKPSKVSRQINGKLRWSLEDALTLSQELNKPVEELFKKE